MYFSDKGDTFKRKSGDIIEEGSFETEFLFQRHPKQTEAHKLAEMQLPEELKYKL